MTVFLGGVCPSVIGTEPVFGLVDGSVHVLGCNLFGFINLVLVIPFEVLDGRVDGILKLALVDINWKRCDGTFQGFLGVLSVPFHVRSGQADDGQSEKRYYLKLHDVDVQNSAVPMYSALKQ